MGSWAPLAKLTCYNPFSAGLGVLNMAYQAVARMTGKEAKPQFFLLDKDVRFFRSVSYVS